MRNGATQVPDISAKTAPILIPLTCRELNPEWSKKVTMVGPNDNTVR
jgi:hypothetical protein